MSAAEVMTTAIVAALWDTGNVERARMTLKEPGDLPSRLSTSRFNRRLPRIKPCSLTVFALVGDPWKALTAQSSDGIDPFPLAASDTYRRPRRNRHRGAADRGDLASQQRASFGLKLHRLVTRRSAGRVLLDPRRGQRRLRPAGLRC